VDPRLPSTSTNPEMKGWDVDGNLGCLERRASGRGELGDLSEGARHGQHRLFAGLIREQRQALSAAESAIERGRADVELVLFVVEDDTERDDGKRRNRLGLHRCLQIISAMPLWPKVIDDCRRHTLSG